MLKYLNIKSLVTEAYHAQKLEKVLPFVCKILEAVKYSSVFRINNPWIQVRRLIQGHPGAADRALAL